MYFGLQLVLFPTIAFGLDLDNIATYHTKIKYLKKMIELLISSDVYYVFVISTLFLSCL